MEVLIPTTLAIVLSVISPLIVGALTKASMSAKTKGWIALGVSVVIALGWTVATGGFAGLVGAVGFAGYVQAIGLAIAPAYAMQQAVYALMFKGTEFAKSVLEGVGVTDGETDATGSGFDSELDGELEDLEGLDEPMSDEELRG